MKDRPSARAALLAAAALLVLVPVAAAHASLLASTPAAGEAVPQAPERVTLHFSEPLDPAFSAVRVENAEGVRLDKGDARFDGKTASVGLPALPKGIYFVRWQALSESDGHTTRGSVPFVVGDASLAAGLLEGATEEVETGGTPEAVARAVHYAGYAAALGGVAFAAFVLPRLPRTLEGTPRLARVARASVLAGAALVALSSLALLVFAVGRNLAPGAGLAEGADFAVSSRSGRLLLARVAGAALVAACVDRFAPGRFVGVGVLVAALAAAGHAAAVAPVFALADAFHLAAASVWVGGLGILAVVASRRFARAPDLIDAFTPVATACVVLVVASGVVDLLALVDVATLPATPWGRQMLAKLALVAAMLALGALNRFLLPRSGGAERWFRRSVTGEFGLGLCVLAVAGLLTNGSPGGAPAATAPDDALRLRGTAGDLGLELVLKPPALVPGVHRFDLLVRDPPGGDHNITNVTLEFSMPSDRSVGKVVVPLEEVSHGEHYGAEGAYLTKAGTWQVDAKVRRTNAYDVKATFTLNVTGEKRP